VSRKRRGGKRNGGETGPPEGVDNSRLLLTGVLGEINATRRSVIASLAAAVAVLAGRRHGLAANLQPLTGKSLQISTDAIDTLQAQNQRTRIVRPDDFLYFEVEYDNIGPVGDPPTELQRLDPGRPAYLIVHHQPQAIAEQAYQEVTADQTSSMPGRSGGAYPSTPAEAAAMIGVESTNIPPSVAQARLAGESRVAFTMPDVPSIPYTLQGLLDAFETWAMNLDSSAQPVPLELLIGNLLLLPNLEIEPDAAAPKRNLTTKEYFQIYKRFPRPGDDLRVPLGALKQLNPNLQLAPASKVEPQPPHEPPNNVTAIELPYRLIQSPLATAGWSHESAPVVHNDRAELWHTRLGTRMDGGVDDRATQPIRAIWSPDYPDPFPSTPFTMALDGVDRKSLVRLMAGYDEVTGGNIGNPLGKKPYTPLPALARRLMLTSLGGWLLEDGEWQERPSGGAFEAKLLVTDTGVDLTQWNHRAAMGRDYYVRVVYAGFLFPFGHAASLVKVTERKFEDRVDGQGRLAVLRQRFFIVVRQHTRSYQRTSQAYHGGDLPFTRIDVLTTTTPDIAAPQSDIEPNPALAREVFWPLVKGPQMPGSTNDFQFQMVGYDHMGRGIPFSSPAMFVSEVRNNPGALAKIVTAYNAEAIDTNLPHRRAPPFNGAVIQLAPQAGAAGDGDTNVPTDQIGFIAAAAISPVQPTDEESEPAQFFPGTDSIKVRLPAVQKLLGTNDPVNTKISDAFKGTNKSAQGPGFTAGNPGQVFLDLLDAAPTLPDGVPSDKGGGLVSPNITPKSLSRTLGAVAAKVAPDVPGEVSDFAAGSFDPAQFLPDMKLLGVVPLTDILKKITGSLANAPKLINQELPDKIVVTFNIHQDDLGEFPPGEPLFVPNAPNDENKQSAFDITSTIVVPRPAVGAGGVTPSPPQATVDGSLTWFKINLFGCIVISFDKLAFGSKPGQKPDVTIDINKDHPVLFKGPLEFVNKLKEYIPANGFSDPPNLAVTLAGITASYSLALPAITVGVMTLQNITIGAGFDLPFDGKPPSARFNFAERHNPFNLTISLLGGGGFLAITVSTAGVQEIEAQLEFGAFAAINLGVAAGAVYIKGGFHFIWSAAKKSVELEAFVELGGSLSILGLISVSITFHVGLTYHEISDPKSNELVGQATLTVEVEVLFFSKSVEVSVEKRFAGSARDPRFIDFIPAASVWQTYCSAFA
jgi:hypothetical protein